MVCAQDSLLRGKTGDSMQEERAVGPGREGLPRGERRRERLGVGTGDLSTACDPRRGAWPGEWGWEEGNGLWQEWWHVDGRMAVGVPWLGAQMPE